MRASFVSRATRLTLVSAMALAITLLAGGGSASADALYVPQVRWVSPTGGGGTCSQAAPCSLANAIANAGVEDTINVLPGTYSGGIVINKPLNVVGINYPVIDAAGAPNGVGIQLTASATNAVVQGFVVEHAQYEGILVGSSTANPNGSPATSGAGVSGVTIARNVVVLNDQGFGGPTGECASTPQAPGDCGEGIHLVSATNSTVVGNWISSNAGGILLSDEFGPNAYNDIAYNLVTDNVDDCGITIASHYVGAASPNGPPPGTLGIFRNTIDHNTVEGNGTVGQGGGILMAGGGPFTAVYENTISNNFAQGNGLAGVVIHQHFGGYFGDNIIENNWLDNNNLTGDYDFSPADPVTTGVLVASGPLPGLPYAQLGMPEPGVLLGTQIIGNVFTNLAVGIWTLNAPSYIAGNTFSIGVNPVVRN